MLKKSAFFLGVFVGVLSAFSTSAGAKEDPFRTFASLWLEILEKAHSDSLDSEVEGALLMALDDGWNHCRDLARSQGAKIQDVIEQPGVLPSGLEAARKSLHFTRYQSLYRQFRSEYGAKIEKLQFLFSEAFPSKPPLPLPETGFHPWFDASTDREFEALFRIRMKAGPLEYPFHSWLQDTSLFVADLFDVQGRDLELRDEYSRFLRKVGKDPDWQKAAQLVRENPSVGLLRQMSSNQNPHLREVHFLLDQRYGKVLNTYALMFQKTFGWGQKTAGSGAAGFFQRSPRFEGRHAFYRFAFSLDELLDRARTAKSTLDQAFAELETSEAYCRKALNSSHGGWRYPLE